MPPQATWSAARPVVCVQRVQHSSAQHSSAQFSEGQWWYAWVIMANAWPLKQPRWISNIRGTAQGLPVRHMAHGVRSAWFSTTAPEWGGISGSHAWIRAATDHRGRPPRGVLYLRNVSEPAHTCAYLRIPAHTCANRIVQLSGSAPFSELVSYYPSKRRRQGQGLWLGKASPRTTRKTNPASA